MSIIETMANRKVELVRGAEFYLLNKVEKLVDKHVDIRNKKVEELNREMSGDMPSIPKVNDLMDEIDFRDDVIKNLIKKHDDLVSAMNCKYTLLSDVYVGIL